MRGTPDQHPMMMSLCAADCKILGLLYKLNAKDVPKFDNEWSILDVQVFILLDVLFP